MGSDLVAVRRALISVSDKTGLEGFARGLVEEFGVELISTGGTAKFLRGVGLKVTEVSEVTGFPEMMDGRVKTLHPKIHGGLLAIRDNAEHVAAAKEHGIGFIDLVCINLYPFAETIAKPGVTFEEAVENIDIGGPSMVRSAAKNHGFVAVVTEAGQYEKVLGDLREHKGATCGRHRLKLAAKAFELTASYDRMIAGYLGGRVQGSGVRGQEGKGQTGGGVGRFMSGPEEGRIGLAMEEESEAKSGAQSRSQRRSIERLKKSAGNLPQFLHDLLMAQAVGVAGTEAACFMVGGQGLTLVDHIRPGRETAEVRGQAVVAFREIVTPCVKQGQDGAIEIGGSEDAKGVQYCLVTLLRQGEKVVAVTGVIARCRDNEHAKERLTSMQMVADFFDLFSVKGSVEQGLPVTIALQLEKKQELRYGENPHQKGGLYVGGAGNVERSTSNVQRPRGEASVVGAIQHHGKELSYINLLDADAAMGAVKEFWDRAAACVVKHATPCGLGVGSTIAEAFGKAYAGDPVAAFGGIVALNRVVDEETARQMVEGQKFLEVVVSPGYEGGALELLKARWKNVRLLEVPGEWRMVKGEREMMMHKIAGGYLVQERDEVGIVESEWKVVSERKPSEGEMEDMRVAWLACKHVKSNAIVIAKGGMMLGAGAGQQDRVNACRIAVLKAGERAKGAVAASDAFFPFADGPGVLMDAGVVGLVQPGGSVRDGETIELVNKRGGVMVVTGRRHFKH